MKFILLSALAAMVFAGSPVATEGCVGEGIVVVAGKEDREAKPVRKDSKERLRTRSKGRSVSGGRYGCKDGKCRRHHTEAEKAKWRADHPHGVKHHPRYRTEEEKAKWRAEHPNSHKSHRRHHKFTEAEKAKWRSEHPSAGKRCKYEGLTETERAKLKAAKAKWRAEYGDKKCRHYKESAEGCKAADPKI